MSDLSNCCSPCTPAQLPPLAIPGPQGPTGAAGTNGTNGVSAFTTLTAQVGPTPADTTTTYTLSVANSTAFVVGQDIIAGQGPGVALANPGPLAMVITAIPSPNNITVKNLRVADQTVTVSSGAVVSVSGFPPASPLAIANGGTGSTTKGAAQLALGLGQDALISSGAALAQAIATLAPAFAQVGAIDVQILTVGHYLVYGWVGIDFNGTTFAANRTISCRIQNITHVATLATGVMHTQNPTTTSYPTHFLYLPPTLYTTAIANDHLQLQINIDTANTAGTLSVDSGSLVAVPLTFT